MRPFPIETAPRDGREILLLSVQQPVRGCRLISIHNAHWSREQEAFMLGSTDELRPIVDGVSTHWLPIDAVVWPDMNPPTDEHSFPKGWSGLPESNRS